MGSIVEPTQALLESLVAPYLETQPSGLGFAIGYASPSFPNFELGSRVIDQARRRVLDGVLNSKLTRWRCNRAVEGAG